MQITVELPDDIAKHTNPGREALEALVLEAYKSRKLTQSQAGQLLELSRIQTEDFLARRAALAAPYRLGRDRTLNPLKCLRKSANGEVGAHLLALFRGLR